MSTGDLRDDRPGLRGLVTAWVRVIAAFLGVLTMVAGAWATALTSDSVASKLESSGLTYVYDAHMQVVAPPHDVPTVPDATTTPASNTRADADGARPVPRTSPEVDRLVSGSCVATKAGAGARGAYGGLSRAGDYGVWPYKTLTSDLRGTGLQAHHLVEKRFAGVLGQSQRDMASVAVTKAEHQAFTNAWRREIPYGDGTRLATRSQVEAAASRIYANHPEMRRALSLP